MKILVYPKDSNPYQQLLYSQFSNQDEIIYLQHKFWNNFLSLLFLPCQIIFFRLCGFNVFHLHWVYTFRFKSSKKLYKSFPFKLFMTIYCIFILILTKLLKYKLVWTAHDLIPHGDYFVSNSFVTKALSLLSNAIIVHSKYSKEPMKKLGIDINKVHIIKIGNYIGLYKNNISMNMARNKLELFKNDLVFGMFGKIEKYKGVTSLIENFIKSNIPNSKLIIVGICPDPNLRKQIEDLAKDSPNIKLVLSFIEDDYVQNYINSFDILVYPFNNITTSSSVILAMSFKKPVICPRIGDLVELPEYSGIYYNLNDLEGLQNSMKKAYTQKNNLKEMGNRAFTYIESLNWTDIANSTHEVYNSTLSV